MPQRLGRQGKKALAEYTHYHKCARCERPRVVANNSSMCKPMTAHWCIETCARCRYDIALGRKHGTAVER